jgi:hypothetical protein
MMTTHGEIIVYQTDDGNVKLDVRLQDETVWLTQAMMAELFSCSHDDVSLHLRSIYEGSELDPEATSEDFSIVRPEGSRQVTRSIRHYNLDASISVGYRVKSKVATRFRIWVTDRLKGYIVKGFTMDDERLRNPPGPDDDDTLHFFGVIQNKLHFAAASKTAAELIRSRADAELPNMGITYCKGDDIRKSDITVVTPEIESMANVVIHQRLGHGNRAPDE